MVQLVALEGFEEWEEWEEWGVGGGLVWWVAVEERWGRPRPRRERGGRKSGSEPGRRASQNTGERNRLEPRLIMDLDLAVTDSRSLCNLAVWLQYLQKLFQGRLNQSESLDF